MDFTFLICLIFLYVICIWVIAFNVLYVTGFNVLQKRLIVVCLFLPPIGLILFFLFKIKMRNQEPIKHTIRKKDKVYYGGYKGGHNMPKK